MKVQKIYVRNLRQIDEITADFNGCTAIVTGGNNKGKSTLLKSIIERLRGDKTTIIKEGMKSGESEWTFTDGSILSWELLGNSDKITYTTKDGTKIIGIKEICNMLFGVGFDIDEFIQAQPKKQKEIMEKLVGLDFTEINKEYEEAYNDRTAKNAIYRSETAKLLDYKETPIEGEYIDISDMQNELIEAEKKNEQIQSIDEKMTYKSKRLLSVNEEIKRLQEEKTAIVEDITKGEKRLKANIKQDTQELRKKIDDQKEINKAHEQNRYFYEQQEKIEIAKSIADEADEAVKTIENRKMDMVKSVTMPKGFEFSEDGLLFNSYPLDKSHLSSSQTYIAGLMLASMNMGEVQTLTFDASYLDKNSLAEIEKWANDNNLQLLIERPDFDGGDIKYEIINDKK